jgi:hypothetical protein
MKKTNIKTFRKTFRALLIEDNMRIKDLAQLVEVNGTLYINKWGEWKASLPGNAETKDVIDAALDALADYASADINRDSQGKEEFYDLYTHHPLDNFGFTTGDNNQLFIEKTALQTPQELISQLQSELTSAKHSVKPKANKGRWAETKKHRAAVRKAAKKLWEEDNTRTIADIIDDDKINITKKSDGTNYSEGTLREWTRDLAPSNKPGRPKEN